MAMVLPSALPPPPPRLESNAFRVSEILANGYRAAMDIVNLDQPDLHRVHYHRERVSSEFVPLLDAVFESTSDTATHSWCLRVTETLTDLFNCLVQCEAAAQHWYVV